MKDQSLKLKTVTEDPFNAETPFSALKDDRTASESFYIRNHFAIPSINIPEFRLKVNGALTNPLEISLDQLKSFGESKLILVMECAGNGRTSMKPAIKGTPWNLGAVSQAEFVGTSLQNLLSKADPSAEAVEVKFTGADQGKIHTGEINLYARSLPLEVAMHPDTMLAWEMNGQALSAQHGYPLRLVVPGWYGMASVKWLQKITILTEPFSGFFQTQEYVYIGEEGTADHTPVTHMRVRSLILEPQEGAIINGETFLISGIAWSGSGRVTQVELSFDEGQNWASAIIKPAEIGYGTAHWEHHWKPEEKGDITILARAFDSNGDVQPLEPRWNKGGYGNNVVHRVKIYIE
jgi:DMSO/TMAO reductase YedYZ molybdopterin-dependent catalytic subunit